MRQFSFCSLLWVTEKRTDFWVLKILPNSNTTVFKHQKLWMEMLPARVYHWCVFGLEGSVIWQGPYGGLQMEETKMNHNYKFWKIHLSLMGANNARNGKSRQTSDERSCETQQSLSLPTSSSCYSSKVYSFLPYLAQLSPLFGIFTRGEWMPFPL